LVYITQRSQEGRRGRSSAGCSERVGREIAAGRKGDTTRPPDAPAAPPPRRVVCEQGGGEEEVCRAKRIIAGGTGQNCNGGEH